MNAHTTTKKKKYRKRIITFTRVKLDAFTEAILKEKERLAAIRREERKKQTTYIPVMGTRARFSVSDYVPQKGRFMMSYKDRISQSIHGTFCSLSKGALGGAYW